MDYSDYLNLTLNTKHFFVEDVLKAQAMCLQSYAAQNTIEMYEKFRNDYISKSSTKQCPIVWTGKQDPKIMRTREMAEIVTCIRKLPGNRFSSPLECLKQMMLLKEKDLPLLERIVKINISNLRKLRAARYMYYSPALPNPIPLFNIDNKEHMTFLYTTMMKIIMYGRELKTMEEVIFQAFDSIANQEEAMKYYTKLEAFKKGNNPEFENDMKVLSVVYAVNWFHGQVQRFMNTGNMALASFYEYAKHNSMLRSGLLFLALSYKGDGQPALFRYYIMICSFIAFGIEIHPALIDDALALVDSFLDTFQFNLVQADEKLQFGFRLAMKAVEIIATSLQLESEYTPWLVKNNTSRWWYGHMEF